MGKGRLEAFSDGVIAIIITIMVLDLKAPHEPTLEAMRPLWPIFLSYVISFIYVGIYWNNHHHLLHTAHRVNGKILWANLHLLFWLSLVPFVTGWVGDSEFQTVPVVIYGVLLMLAGLAYLVLTRTLIGCHGNGSALAEAVGRDRKGKLSLALYAVGVAAAFFHPWVGFAVYIIVAAMWIIPDPRIARRLGEEPSETERE